MLVSASSAKRCLSLGMPQLGFVPRCAVVVEPCADRLAQLLFQLPELGTCGEVVARAVGIEYRLARRKQRLRHVAPLFFGDCRKVGGQQHMDDVEAREEQPAEQALVGLAKSGVGRSAGVAALSIQHGRRIAAAFEQFVVVFELGVALMQEIRQTRHEPCFRESFHRFVLSATTTALLRRRGLALLLALCLYFLLLAAFIRQHVRLAVDLQRAALERLAVAGLDVVAGDAFVAT